MNYRLNTAALTAVGLLVVVAAGLFGYTYFIMPQEEKAPSTLTSTPQAPTEGRIITAKHQYSDGIHTVAGEIEVPTPCHRLEAETFVGAGGAIEIRLTTILIEEEAACAQVVTPTRFKVTFEAPETAPIEGSLNGAPFTFNLVPVPEGENLDDFEVFIKG